MINRFSKLLGLALVSQVFITSSARAFNVGFNQGWMNGRFEHQWLNGQYDAKEANRILSLAKLGGAKILRVWLFEGQNSNALIWTGGSISGIHPEFLKNFELFLVAAKEHGILIYPTLFSAGSLDKLEAGPIRDRWWNLFNQKFGGLESFKTNALKPLLHLFYRSDIRESVYAIDIANELDAAIYHHRFENDWHSANQMICSLRNFVHQEADENGSNFIKVTASIGWPWVPFFSRAAADVLIDPNPHPNCVDFWDLHLYNNGGRIPNCEKIRAQGKRYDKKIILGEFGQFSKTFNDKLQLTSTANFVKNAQDCGFDTALAWSLSDQSESDSSASRFTFEMNGKMRPAFEFIKRFNSKNR